MPRPSSLSTSVDEGVLEDAARHLYSHLGCLLDLPEELRNTLASVYYEVHCQRRSKSTPLAGVKMHHLMRFSPALAVVPVVHRRDARCFV